MKKKINVQSLFLGMSILFILLTCSYFFGRLVYYKKKSEKIKIPSSSLATRLIEEEYGNAYERKSNLVSQNGGYHYVKNPEDNYVKYKGFLWRVIKINEDNTVTLITENSVTSLPYGNSLEESILPWLNKLEKNYTGIMENSLEAKEELKKVTLCIDQFQTLEEATCFHSSNQFSIGLLSIDDYLEANANESFLNNGEAFWTSNSYNEKNAWFISENGRVSFDKSDTKLGIRPVITISGDTKIQSGNGTADDPYNLNPTNPKILLDAYVGEYIVFNNQLWKIVSKDSKNVKVVSEECLKNEKRECLLMSYGTSSNNIDKSELMNYLQKSYYNSIAKKEYIETGTFYIGNYSLLKNNYQTGFDTQKKLKIGFLSVGEIFAYEIDNSFLMNTSPNNNLSIYSVKNHSPYQNIVNAKLTIRPSFYLKGNIAIQAGNGSYLFPYQLGEEI